MGTAIIFPGQGAQSVGMGKDLYDNFKIAREVFEEANDALSSNLTKIIFEGPEEDLTLTQNTQPALMAVSIAALKVYLQELGKSVNDIALYAAGHSLGEYSALCAAGALSLYDTAKLLRIRGEAMASSCPEGVGAMAAVLGADAQLVENVISKINSPSSLCQIANDNSKEQIVISGHKDTIERAVAEFKEMKIKAVLLKVSAAFHSELMAPARDVMQQALEHANIAAPKLDIIPNVTIVPTRLPIEIKNNLVTQVAGRVRWRETMEFFVQNDIDKVIEFGSGKVLTTLFKRSYPEIQTYNITSSTDIKGIIADKSLI